MKPPRGTCGSALRQLRGRFEDLWLGSFQERLAAPQDSVLWAVLFRNLPTPGQAGLTLPAWNHGSDRHSRTAGPGAAEERNCESEMGSTCDGTIPPLWVCDSGTDARAENQVFSRREPLGAQGQLLAHDGGRGECPPVMAALWETSNSFPRGWGRS